MLDNDLEKIIVDAATERARRESVKRHRKADKFARLAARKLRRMFKTDVEVVKLDHKSVFVPGLGVRLSYFDDEIVDAPRHQQGFVVLTGWHIVVGDRYVPVHDPADFAPLLQLNGDADHGPYRNHS